MTLANILIFIVGGALGWWFADLLRKKRAQK